MDTREAMTTINVTPNTIFFEICVVTNVINDVIQVNNISNKQSDQNEIKRILCDWHN